MSDSIMLILTIVVGIDALANLFMILYAPKWMEYKRSEIKELREQNAELRTFIREVLNK